MKLKFKEIDTRQAKNIGCLTFRQSSPKLMFIWFDTFTGADHSERTHVRKKIGNYNSVILHNIVI